MMQTLEAVIDENGKVQLLENIRLPQARRALLMILDDEPQQSKIENQLSNQELLNALNEAYANDADDEEKEFLRLANIKQPEILDEWK